MISFVCLLETELSSEESSCEHVGASGKVHRRHGKRPHKPSLLSSLGSCSKYCTHVNSDGVKLEPRSKSLSLGAHAYTFSYMEREGRGRGRGAGGDQ